MYLVGIFGLNVDIIKVLKQLLFTQTSQLNFKSSCMLSTGVLGLGAFSGAFPGCSPAVINTLRSVKVFMGLARFHNLKAFRRGGECEGARTLC